VEIVEGDVHSPLLPGRRRGSAKIKPTSVRSSFYRPFFSKPLVPKKPVKQKIRFLAWSEYSLS
jgi:hypothetical protein